MSRCFPFPASGYEKKARLDDANLLTKEKHEEKKHKKDKDKERRELKEKKDKERSKEKHSEKKDRKDKHKDKKNKDRDKEKKRTSDEKKTVGLPECHNGEKLGPNLVQSDGTKDCKILLELGKRIRRDDGATQNQMVQKIKVTDQRSTELAGKVVENNIGNLAEGNEKLKHRGEQERKIDRQSNKVEARIMENSLVQNFAVGDKSSSEAVDRLLDKDVKKRMQEEEKNKQKKSDNGGDKHKDRDREKKRKSKDKKKGKEKEKEEKAKEKEQHKELLKLRESGKDAVDIHDVKPSDLLKESNKHSGSDLLKESNKHSGSEGNIGKRKGLEMNGTSHANDIRPTKLPKPVSFSHQVVENGQKVEPCQNAIPFASEVKGTVDNDKLNNKISSSHLIMENGRKSQPSDWRGTVGNHKVKNGVSSSHPALENRRKLEQCQTANQFASLCQGTVNNDHKVNNKISSSHQAVENGKKLEPCQTTSQSVCERQLVVGNHKLNNKDSRINGLIEAQIPNACLVRPSSASMKVKENVKVSLKPPHPDSKYLSQILSVPQIEWSNFDDQEWLFSGDNLQSKKPKLASSQVEGTKQVWAEVLHIESADVIALPYVVPY